MKNTAQSSSNSMRGDTAPLFACSQVLLGAFIVLALCGCDRVETRAAAPELSRLLETAAPSPPETQNTTICAALPAPPNTAIMVQEFMKDRSVALAFRLATEKNTDGTTRYAVGSLRIQTTPTQIPWNSRLEEEMENWAATVTPGNAQEWSLRLGDESAGHAKKQTALGAFKDILATGLGSLHMLRQWCGSEKKGAVTTPPRIHLDLPGKPSLVLQNDGAKARVVSGDRYWDLSTIAGGVQALHSTPPTKSPEPMNKTVVFKILSIESP